LGNLVDFRGDKNPSELYKFLYTNGQRSAKVSSVVEPASPDVVFEGDSQDIVRSFPEAVRWNLGGDLQRVQDGDRPLDSGSMAHSLPGVFELRDEDKDCWYRVLYTKLGGVVYVLHCFTKKTNKTSQRDIELGSKRLSELKQRLKAKTKTKHTKK